MAKPQKPRLKRTDRYPEALELAVKVTMHLYPKPTGANATKEFMERLAEVINELNGFMPPQSDSPEPISDGSVNRKIVKSL